MSSTRPVGTVLCSQDLPLEFRRRSSAHEGDERKVASRLSGIVPARQLDEVICPLPAAAEPPRPGPSRADGGGIIPSALAKRRQSEGPPRRAAHRHFRARSASGYSESCAPRVPPDA